MKGENAICVFDRHNCSHACGHISNRNKYIQRGMIQVLEKPGREKRGGVQRTEYFSV